MAIHFGKPDVQWLSELTPETAQGYIDAGEFAPGSMLPKVQAAVQFASSQEGRTALITLLEKAKAGNLQQTVTLAESVEAPVAAGDVLGSLVLSYDGKVYATVDLLAMHDVEADRLLTFWRDVKAFFARTSVRVALIVLLVLLVLFLVWKLLLSRRRYRYGRSVGYSRSRNYRGRRK